MEGSSRFADSFRACNDIRHWIPARLSSLVSKRTRKHFPKATQRLETRLVNQGRYSEALAVISALEDKPHDHPDVQRTFLAIREAALAEHTVSDEGKPQNNFELSELLHGGRSQNFRRATLGIVIQAFQQITGINLIT